ncbi:MAG TPA: nitrite/sulfite reductase [bacterium]
MANKAEDVKARYGDPFRVRQVIERAASQGMEALSEDDVFMCKWIGLYTHRHEPAYFMLRTKQPNGCITPDQLETIANIAEEKNRGFADITTRQDIQLHWIHVSQAADILRELEAAGIATLGACGDIARNVVGCPVAGVDREELFDPGSVVEELNAFFLGNPAFANLPRKYKIGVSACRTHCTHPEIQCVGLNAAPAPAGAGDEPGFDLRVGGGLSTQPKLSQRLGVFIRRGEAVEVIRHLTELWRDTPEYREKRHHARLKFLVADWGVARVRAALEERVGRRLTDAASDFQEPHDAFRDHLGAHAQRQPGLFYIGAPVLIGRITSPQMRRVAELSRRYADGRSIRLTTRQNLLLLNVPEANVENVLGALAEAELSINAHPIRRSMVTCTGTEFCKLAITETKARSRQIVEYLERRVPLEEPLRLHLTGCPNSCAQYQIANIGLLGAKTKVDGQIVDAYDVFVGGRMGQGAQFNHAVARRIPATDVAKRLERLLVEYRARRRPREAFNDWCARAGDEAVKDLLSEEAAHPLADVARTSAPSDEPAPGGPGEPRSGESSPGATGGPGA